MLEFERVEDLSSADEATSNLHRRVMLCNQDIFVRDCFARALSGAGYDVLAVSSVAEGLASQKPANERQARTLVIYCIGAHRITESPILDDIDAILTQEAQPLLMIAGNLNNARQVVEALKSGAKGYFALDTPLNIALVALQLVLAGGVYLPPSILTPGTPSEVEDRAPEADVENKLLTSRQTAVVAALRQGKSNKIIAYELNLCESTVKVHIRTVMKKLGARNRTEVAFLTRKLFQVDDSLAQFTE